MSTTLIATISPTMSTREIAEITDKRHSNVLRDVRSMLSSIYGGGQEDYLPEKLLVNQQTSTLSSVTEPSNLSESVSVSQYGVNNANQPVYEYKLDRDHTLTLLTGYDIKARFKVVQRWQELESKVVRQNEIIQAGQSYWKSVRYDLAITYNKMMQIIDLLGRREGWTADETLRVKWREADMLNLIVMGMTSRDIRSWYDIKLPIRNSFPNKILAAYHYIEQHNIAMLVNGTPYQKRFEGLEYLLSLEFPDVLIYRNTQKELIQRRTETKDWDLMPTHPKDWPSMRFPNEMMLRYNISPEELETSAQLMLEGEA